MLMRGMQSVHEAVHTGNVAAAVPNAPTSEATVARHVRTLGRQPRTMSTLHLQAEHAFSLAGHQHRGSLKHNAAYIPRCVMQALFTPLLFKQKRKSLPPSLQVCTPTQSSALLENMVDY